MATDSNKASCTDIRWREPHKSTRVGLVGFGYWGSKHVRVLAGLPGVDVTVIEHQPDRLREAMTSFPGIQCASQLIEVQDELDAVVIATPPESHGHVALQALRGGLHTLVEKPLATSISAAETLVETAEQVGVTLMVGHTFEYNAATRKLKQLVSSGELGRILYIHTARLNLGRYQDNCNVIWDLAPHDISIIAYLMDEFPDTASVWAQRNLGDVHADVAYVRLDFGGASAPAFIHVSWLDPNKVRRVTVVGDRKMVVYNDLSETDRIRIYDVGVVPAEVGASSGTYAMPVTYRTGDITSPYVPFVEPLLVQDTHFIDCVRTGRRPDTPGEDGLAVVRVLAATDEACTTGAPVRIQPPKVDRSAPVVPPAEAAS
ncbi:Gfo/Idh/MocA family protein [Mycobacterium sp.]|uniref:Gfo/Idh/MocA family protein n=1 Tax=Mycobacterium sp. TaxID=1785 RepID=UPI002DAE3786|nr:Gfo/Idh/MocA family oxidoreductase [Mycobacterium sp.]